MRLKFVLACMFLSIGLFAQAAYAGAGVSSNPGVLARLAVSENPAEAGPALAALRDQGPAGLAVLFQVYGSDLSKYAAEDPAKRAADPGWARLTAAFDAVSQQRDSYASGLYWYTDFDKAKAAARAQGKPILSLRLLGNLTDEFSCANSRFFRAFLYSNAEVSAFLRERFILHWKSVRPAPRVTIDFGDGRKLERTVTGNSIHYVLDSDGRPIDAIPGLYGPRAFLRELGQADALFGKISSRTVDRNTAIREFHLAARRQAVSDWQTDIRRTGVTMKADDSAAESDGSPKPAAQAGAVAITKSTVESKTVRLIGTGASALAEPAAAAGTAAAESTSWQKIAGLHSDEVQLDAASIALIRSQFRTPQITEDALKRVLANLRTNLALDTVRNRYLLHSRIHQWFADGLATGDVDALNELVYARLFETPSSDPWLGLFSPDTYSGLVDGGVGRR